MGNVKFRTGVLEGLHMNYAPYSRSEVRVLLDLVHEHGHLTYADTQVYQPEYVAKTHSWRSSGALYQAAYRAEQGFYDDML
jgi:hypothetical protein